MNKKIRMGTNINKKSGKILDAIETKTEINFSSYCSNRINEILQKYTKIKKNGEGNE